MDIFSVIEFLGGLALFLYGMNTLAQGLEKLSGGRLEKILESLTSNVFKSVLLGAFVTAAVQSSSATTVIIVGLVNARILKLNQAIGVIMGANIGTTITAHILSLADISSSNVFLKMLKPSTLAPTAAIIGILLLIGAKSSKKRDMGQILLGFATLFTGMFGMEGAVYALRELPAFSEMFASLSNPVLGVLVGAFVTAVIQSSSASVGILQALSTTGQITYSAAFPIIMGQNIGTCITPMLASIGASKNAKRTAIVHLSFNIIGTVVFLIATYSVHAAVQFSFWENPIGRSDIAVFHTLFNVCVTLAFIPFVKQLEKLALFVIKDNEDDVDSYNVADKLDDMFLQSPGLALQHSREVVVKMGEIAKENLAQAINLFKKYDAKIVENVTEAEDVLDKLEDRLNIYLLELSKKDLSQEEGEKVSLLLHMIGEYERVGDYAINIIEEIQNLRDAEVSLSKGAYEELELLSTATLEILNIANQAFSDNDSNAVLEIEPLEEVIDLIQATLKDQHIARLKDGQCSVDSAFPYLSSIASLERVGDHCSNIGLYIATHDKKSNLSSFNMHYAVKNIKSINKETYDANYNKFEEKYYSKIAK